MQFIFQVDITPAGPTFATWGLIYIWQLAWLIYNVIVLFIVTSSSPLVLNAFFQVLIFINFVSNCSWLFLFDRQLFSVSLAVIIIMTGTLYGALAISHVNIYNARLILDSR
jgi:hypothetical protein